MSNTTLYVGASEDSEDELHYWTVSRTSSGVRSLIKRAVNGEGSPFIVNDYEKARVWVNDEGVFYLADCVEDEDRFVLNTLDTIFMEMCNQNSNPLSFLDFSKSFPGFPNGEVGGSDATSTMRRFLASSEVDTWFNQNDWTGWAFPQANGTRNFSRAFEEIEAISVLTGVNPLVIDAWIKLKGRWASEELDHLIASVESWDGFRDFFEKSHAKTKLYMRNHMGMVVMVLAWAKQSATIETIVKMSGHGTLLDGSINVINSAGFGHVLKSSQEAENG